ncbi:MAG: DEAD/DEAH box helicase, partial [Planctomyces sp.]
TIIVGDPKQLPPTSFFQKSDAGESEDELPVWERDLESILDEAVAAGLPRLQLNWHYRSRHESLIAFSNQHYYDGTLVTLPSTAARDTAVNLVYLPHAVYDRGETRTNRVEAEAIVRQLLLRLQQLPAEAADRLSFGVITFNQQQQKLIEDLLDEARRQDPGLEQFFSDDQPEPVFVKNLENVQGDERDVILFSVAFGLNERGQLPLNLGALN